ncbi:MAG: type VI secretion system baseplate subunit TssG [Alphaproteobacteria bacterium]|nr:type VI secretion system baseplate subunit TssG [Alphaproteobacteria bacterium]
MADDDRAPSHALGPDALAFYEALRARPYAFDFFQALRRIDALNRERPRIGESARLADDPVRLGQTPSLIFAPSTMASFEPAEDGRPPRLQSYFFGIFGPSGALPLHLTEYARDRIRNSGDRTFARFVDIFHHRMLSLFYRAWAASQPAVNFDRKRADRFSAYVGTLFGLGLPSLRDRDAMPDLAKLHFSGHLTHQTRNAEGLRAIIADYFKLPVEIEQFIGDWVSLPRQSLCLLGRTPDTGTLGSTASIGERIHVYHHKFRILFGPIGFDDYVRLLPGGTSLKRLVPIVRNYVGDEFSWDVNLILLKEEVPALRLGEAGLLGWTTWLGTRRSERDADDLLLDPYFNAA